ncbi:amidohydrolase [Mesorhizobium sp. Pch-S]|uniref:amidohydrolase family protein n=1 Tax=Mesorhizobium sp. Pch-S TaxID=2082387 RepID=UPI00101385CD|nr:amidohydrolase [Mesorhizobium sp. Pch-S]QAZ47240.1 cytosine deaminase [Mesorhizobium sp. Pch-S]
MMSLILCADHLITMDDNNTVITNGAIAVGTNGRIKAVGEAASVIAANPGIPVRKLANRLLMPGLINAHAHSGLLRGTAEGLPVWEWLQQYIDPMHRVVNAKEAEIASHLCYAEALLSGTTTILDMWRYMHGSAKVARELGIRAVLVPYVGEHPDHNYFETLDTNEALIQEWHGRAEGRIQVWVGLEHMFYGTPDAWTRATELSRKYKVGFHTHSNESRFDVEETERRYGKRPVQALEAFGMLDAHHVLLAHCVWLSEDEIDILARRKVGVAHNPVSNMKLASGAAPVLSLRKKGVAVGIGTDGEKENNNLDMFDEMKSASLLAKVSTLDAAALDAWSVCRMATIDGARALNLHKQIGSLEVGKQADLIAVRTDTPRMTPLLGGAAGNLHHNLVHAVQGGDVDLTMVAGRIVVDGGRLLTADVGALIAEVNAVVPSLFERRAEWLKSHGAINELRRAAAESVEMA